MWVYFSALSFVALIFISIFLPIPCCFDYYRLVVKFEIRECDTSSFVPFSEDCFEHLGLLCFHISFSIASSISVKNAISIFIEIPLNL